MRKYLFIKHPILLINAVIATWLSDVLWLVFSFNLRDIIDTAATGNLERLKWELIKGTALLMVIAFTIYLGHAARGIYQKKIMV